MQTIQPTNEKSININPLITLKPLACLLLAHLNGAAYFFVSVAGADNLRKLFHMTHGNTGMNLLIYALGIGASICYAAFTYIMLDNISLKIKSPLSAGLALLSLIAASSFLTAGIEGAFIMNLNKTSALGIGIFLYLLRVLAMIDGDVKFSLQKNELVQQIKTAMYEGNIKDLIRITIALYTAIGFTACATDSIYAAITLVATSFLHHPFHEFSLTIAFISTAGSIAIFPLIYNWTKRGINQLSFGGIVNEAGIMRDPTDKYTAIALFASIPVILGSLGSVTESSGHMFSQLGAFSDMVRISSSMCYGICGAIPGLSMLARALPRTLKTLKRIFSIKYRLILRNQQL